MAIRSSLNSTAQRPTADRTPHPHRSTTLAAGVISLLLLLICLFGMLWYVLDRQNQAVLRTDLYNRAVTEVQKLLRGVDEIAVSEGAPASRALAAEAISQLEILQPSFDKDDFGGRAGVDFDALRKRAAAFVAEKDVSVSNTQAVKLLGQISADAGKLRDSLMSDEVQARARARTAATLTHILLLCAALISIAGTVLMFWVFHRRVTRPLSRAVTVAERISNGDLSLTVNTENAGEVTPLMIGLDAMQRRLARLAADVRRHTGLVADSAAQLSAGSADLSSRTEQQATTLEETAASMEQIATSAREASTNTQLANDLSNKAVVAARAGGAVVTSAVNKINAIQDSSHRIEDITSVIDSIAFQTNILALNAAVEAARAGEQGRGFAVVAAEVRALAQRSATAAREIKTLIGTSVTDIKSGTALIHAAGSSMKHIVEANEEVVTVIGNITAASADQAGGIEQINHAILQLEAVTQQNAAMVEEASASADGMRDNAAALLRLVERFKLSGTESSTARAPAITSENRYAQRTISQRPALPPR